MWYKASCIGAEQQNEKNRKSHWEEVRIVFINTSVYFIKNRELNLKRSFNNYFWEILNRRYYALPHTNAALKFID